MLEFAVRRVYLSRKVKFEEISFKYTESALVPIFKPELI